MLQIIKPFTPGCIICSSARHAARQGEKVKPRIPHQLFKRAEGRYRYGMAAPHQFFFRRT